MNLAQEEARRQHELEAVRLGTEPDLVAEMAPRMKGKAVLEVVETQGDVTRARFVARIGQFVNYGFGIVYGIIGLEIALELLGAREGTGFKEFVDGLSAPLLAPFSGLLMEPAVGSFAFRTSYVVAIIVYMLLHAAVIGLLKVVGTRETSIG